MQKKLNLFLKKFKYKIKYHLKTLMMNRNNEINLYYPQFVKYKKSKKISIIY